MATASVTVRSTRLAWRTPVHPGAWWLWALALATLASRTSDPLLLLMEAAATYLVAMRCRAPGPWARSYRLFAIVAATAIVVRVVLAVLFVRGADGSPVLATLPSVTLPSWAGSVQIGGPVTEQTLVFALVTGAQVAVLILALGAANTVTTPHRLLKTLPAAFYELGVAVTVAISFAPHVAVSISRIRQARMLRGAPAGLRGLAVPVLTDALDRSVALAAAMDVRGFGRQRRDTRARQAGALALLLALILTATGGYLLLAGQSAPTAAVIALAIGVALGVTGVTLASAASTRSRYRPDVFGSRSIAVAACGIIPAAWALAAGWTSSTVLDATGSLTWPQIPLAAVLVVAATALPAVLASA